MKKTLIVALMSVIAGTSLAFAHGGDEKTYTIGFANRKVSEWFTDNWKEKNNGNKDRKNKNNNSGKTDAERLSDLKAKTLPEIDSRITALNNLNSRIQAQTNITAANKAIIAANIQTHVTALNTLRAKVVSSTDLSTLKTEIKALKKSFKIFGLSIPGYDFAGKVDRHFAEITNLASTSVALNANIQTASSSGRNVSGLNTQLAEMNTRIANANTQSNAALALVAPILPNMGSSTVILANQGILQEAYNRYQIALEEIRNAKNIARNIINQLRDWGIQVTASVNN